MSLETVIVTYCGGFISLRLSYRTGTYLIEKKEETMDDAAGEEPEWEEVRDFDDREDAWNFIRREVGWD